MSKCFLLLPDAPDTFWWLHQKSHRALALWLFCY